MALTKTEFMEATEEGAHILGLEVPKPGSNGKAPRAELIESVGFNRTDYGNAERLVNAFGETIRFCDRRGGWLFFDGMRWALDETAEIVRTAKVVVRRMYEEAAKIDDDKARGALVNHAKRSEAGGRIKAMIQLAESEAGIAIAAQELDADPWLFNCANGTIDLHTGELLAHDPSRLITKCSPVDFDPDARSELWDRFLSETTGGNEELIYFLQRAAGYSLTGDTREEKLFFIYGPTRSGKSTFAESLKATFGDYAMTSDFETFLQRSFVGGPRNDIARLAGARFVASIEVDEGKKLAEGLVKTLTGGDTIAARFLHHEAFEFQPQFKLWLAANHAPKVRDDDAIWSRILRLPFSYTIPKEKVDPSVKAKLTDPDESGAAILAWCVKGCLDWQRSGLGVPKIVEDSTNEYKIESDELRGFLDEVVTLSPGAKIASETLWGSYKQWAGNDAMNRTDFNRRLRALGCEPCLVTVADERKRGWRGIGLSEPGE